MMLVMSGHSYTLSEQQPGGGGIKVLWIGEEGWSRNLLTGSRGTEDQNVSGH